VAHEQQQQQAAAQAFTQVAQQAAAAAQDQNLHVSGALLAESQSCRQLRTISCNNQEPREDSSSSFRLIVGFEFV